MTNTNSELDRLDHYTDGRVIISEAYLNQLLLKAKIRNLTELLTEHDAICGATFQKDERDDCTFKQQILDSLKELQEGTE